MKALYVETKRKLEEEVRFYQRQRSRPPTQKEAIVAEICMVLLTVEIIIIIIAVATLVQIHHIDSRK